MSLPRVDAGLLPAFHLPMRFFLTALCFALAALCWLGLAGPAVWLTRWHPVLLGVTHLQVLGLMAMTMIGALAQVVPVLALRPLPGAARLLPLVHLLLLAGVSFLSLGLGLHRGGLLKAALPLLAAAFLLVLAQLGGALLRRSSGRGSVHSVRLAGFALALTVGLGVWLGLARALPGRLATSLHLTDTHALLGLGGWVGLLILGVGSQVIPMFHVTPAIPPRRLQVLNALALAGLLLVSSGSLGCMRCWYAGALLLSLALAGFGLQALHLLAQRARKIPDATIEAWRIAILYLLVALFLFACSSMAPLSLLHSMKLQLAAALLVLFGVIQTVILGMLLKIVPFLAWTHLQNQAGLDFERLSRVPHMHAFIAKRPGQRVIRLQAAGAGLLAFAPFISAAHWPGLFLLALANGWMLLLLGKSLKTYLSCAKVFQD